MSPQIWEVFRHFIKYSLCSFSLAASGAPVMCMLVWLLVSYRPLKLFLLLFGLRSLLSPAGIVSVAPSSPLGLLSAYSDLNFSYQALYISDTGFLCRFLSLSLLFSILFTCHFLDDLHIFLYFYGHF